MQLHETEYGRRLFEYQLPQLMASFSSIAKEMKRANDLAETKQWNEAITLANNICVRMSDRFNDDDLTDQATALTDVAKEIRGYIK